MDEESIDQRIRKCQLGYLQRSDGSCFYSLRETVVLAAVNGPGDLRATKQLYDRALIEINFHSKVGGSNNNTASNRNVERLLKSVCESCVITKQFPRSTVAVTVQEIQDDGSVAASAINSTCLALLDAGLPMRTVFAAVECVLTTDEDGDLILVVEPDSKWEKGAVRARMVFVFENTTSDGEEKTTSLVTCSMDGFMDQNQLKQARKMAASVSEDIFRFYRTVIEKKFGRGTESTDLKNVDMTE